MRLPHIRLPATAIAGFLVTTTQSVHITTGMVALGDTRPFVAQPGWVRATAAVAIIVAIGAGKLTSG
jgi:hypothetical protein